MRPATVDDLPEMAEVHVAAWKWAYEGLLPQALLDAMEVEDKSAGWQRTWKVNPDARHIWVAEADRRLVGFANCGAARGPHEDDLGELYAIYLLRDWTRQGVGRALHDEVIQYLTARGFEEAILWVLSTNTRAQAFYARQGWRPDGARKQERQNGFLLDELRFRRML